MRTARVVNRCRKLLGMSLGVALGLGLIGLLASANGCGGGEDAVAPAVQQPVITGPEPPSDVKPGERIRDVIKRKRPKGEL